MPDESALDRIMTGKSWEEFSDTLKAAGSTILAEGSPAGPLDRAEGFRYLSRLTRAALETFLEYADPLAPVLHRPIHETAKIGAGGTLYVNEDVLSGWLAPLAMWSFGRAMQRGFDDVALALKKRAES